MTKKQNQKASSLQIDTSLVQHLISAQVPQWTHLRISKIEPGGWDNISFLVGEKIVIRMPRDSQYAEKPKKESMWLPILAPLLPFKIPNPLILGKPSDEYPFSWTAYEWIEGETAAFAKKLERNSIAKDLALFLKRLHQIDTTNGPKPNQFHRGASPAPYRTEVHTALETLHNSVNAKKALDIWSPAVSTSWRKPAVWVHGDISAGNILTKNGQLQAIIDFGSLVTGDPACDLAIAWTFFDAESRDLFHNTLAVNLEIDNDTWARGKAWALWKALIVAAGKSTNVIEKEQCWRSLSELGVSI